MLPRSTPPPPFDIISNCVFTLILMQILHPFNSFSDDNETYQGSQDPPGTKSRLPHSEKCHTALTSHPAASAWVSQHKSNLCPCRFPCRGVINGPSHLITVILQVVLIRYFELHSQ